VGEPVRIAVAGLGTVGSASLRLLQGQASLITARAGRGIEVVAVSARHRDRQRDCDLSGLTWYDDPVAMAGESNADVVVELIGGSDGVAKATVEAALGSGKHVVTANKALLAHHGSPLARQAEANGLALAYEAAVAGGIPIIKTLREGMAANAISRVYGILNGTSNFILTNMRKTGRDFDEVLAEATALGYAEADPSFDIDGVDAAHKLPILAALVFGTEVAFDKVYCEGIRKITAFDIASADELGCRIKLLGVASRKEEGIEQRVHPAMVRKTAPMAAVEGVLNAVVAEGDFVGSIMVEGPGAGGEATASAVVADLIDIARRNLLATFAVAAGSLEPAQILPMEKHWGSYYIRLTVLDRPGVIADIAAALRDQQISVESMLQHGRSDGADGPVAVVITTHETTEAAMRRALVGIAAVEAVAEPPCVIRIEGL
jgi:homoserine dehydrogenase